MRMDFEFSNEKQADAFAAGVEERFDLRAGLDFCHDEDPRVFINQH
jgi:hypothetical protein